MQALVVDDDRVLADLVAFTLRHEGFQVSLAYDGQSALQKWRDEEPDLIVLDLNLPKVDGFTVCRRIRAEADTPIIMLTVRGEEDDIVYGLELGADDYIPKPFSPRQLVARVKAVLRRAGKNHVPAIHRVGELTLNASRRELQIGADKTIFLTPLENRLLRYMMINAGHVLDSEAIIAKVWGQEGADQDMLRQLVSRLRRKIEPDPAQPTYIENVPGLGYGLVLPSE
ncbi:MAG: response regulator transcription factor [Chloroflexota bacterium]|nr:MAG: response regulator transcription factor [Chloroflexota bacterium]